MGLVTTVRSEGEARTPGCDSAHAHLLVRTADDVRRWRRPPAGAGRVAGLLLSVVLLAGGPVGCSALSPFEGCEGTESLMRELEDTPLLASPPPGAKAVGGEAAASSSCSDDSGDAWLSARRLLVHPGTAEEVTAHYRRVARADGWRYFAHPEPSDAPPPMKPPSPPPGFAGRHQDVCFTKGGDGSARVVTLYFTSAEELRRTYGRDLGPDIPSGQLYEIEAGAEPDGSVVSPPC
ncbi:hypothetical protein ABT026_05350 [Streptomyces sp. NPDC002734]|uniref:hypothetical protein n=1 Tax=Streptomyces sp. NPDC002734 TaxID=3154426 RepID=UPI0033333979